MTEHTLFAGPAGGSSPQGDPFRPIAAYGLLADCNSAALVDNAGSIDWLCLPRYDSDAIFARLLDPDAGHWSIRPVGAFEAARRYLPGTLVIETTFTTESGSVRLLDALAFAEGQRGHDLGYGAPHEVLRAVEGVGGNVELELELAPRPEYGLVKPLFRAEPHGGRTFGGVGRVAVAAEVPTEISDSTMRASFSVGEGETVGFSLRWAPPEDPSLEPCRADRVRDRITQVADGWRSWEADHDIYDGKHRELVHFSSRVLKGLTYRPTGAVVAAPTSSLPETVDVYGELLNSLHLYRERLGDLHPEVQAFAADLADTAGRRWREKDSGIWEMRGELRHHLQLDRARRLFDRLAGYANDLGLLAEEIDCRSGEQLGNFPQAFSHIGLIKAAWEIDKAGGAAA